MNPKPNTSGESSVRVLADAISLAIKENDGDKRFIDLQRVPLICLSITGMHEDLKEIKEMIKEDRVKSNEAHETFITKDSFAPFKALVYGFVGLILIAVIGAWLSMVLPK